MFGVSGFQGFRVSEFRATVSGFGFRVQSLGYTQLIIRLSVSRAFLARSFLRCSPLRPAEKSSVSARPDGPRA